MLGLFMLRMFCLCLRALHASLACILYRLHFHGLSTKNAPENLRLLKTFEGLLFAECLFFDQIKVNYLNLHFQKQII